MKPVKSFKSWFFQNQTKSLYMFLFPISKLFYYLLGLWIFKKSKWIKKNVAPIWKIVNVAVLSSPATIFISFLLPFIFLMILTNILHPSSALAGIVAQIPVLILVLSMPIIFIDFKRSSLLKRLFVSDIKRGTIIFGFLTYFMFLSLLSITFITTVGILIFWNKNAELFFEYKKIATQFQHINWPGLIFGIIVNIFISGAVGVLISSYSKTPMFGLAVGMLMLIPGGFLTGQFFSIGFILKNDLMYYTSFVFWQKYPTILIIASLDVTNELGHNIFGNTNLEVISGFDKVQPDFIKIAKGINPVVYEEFQTSINKGDLRVAQNKWALLQSSMNGLLKGIKDAKLNDFFIFKKITALTPVLSWISIGVSTLLPIPIYIFGIMNFKWVTR